ncbi:MAG: secretin N-terminal domain-containing protein [Planctomycetota bacterium]
MDSLRKILVVVSQGLFLGSVLFDGQRCIAQQPVVIDAATAKMMAEKAAQGRPSPTSGPPKQGKADENGKKGDEKEGEGGEGSSEIKVIRREEMKGGIADPMELMATVGEDGTVSFEFRDQAWVDLVQWLAEISDQPLDWRELPADRVNMRSPGRYTVEQTHDLFNRYLLQRGYTMLQADGGLTITRTSSINPAVVPRVDIEDLDELQPHSFVRVSLDPGWLPAEKLVEELSPMISSNGKLTAMSTTNRLEAMDAAVNLRQIAKLLDRESNQLSRQTLAPEFPLRYLAAEDAKRMLMDFLGVKEKAETPAMNPEQMRMMQRQMQQQGQNAIPAGPKTPDISIVANIRQNSILIRAPSDRVALAMEFLKRIDVPQSNISNLTDIKSRVQVFRLVTLDPEKLIEIIGEMNVLQPSTRLRPDKDNSAIIVSGSIADRFVIDSLIEKLDNSGRSFVVMPLRRLDPIEVAESIEFLMGKQKEEDSGSSRRRSYYWYYDNEDEDDKPDDEFRVAANVRLKQILLWANEQEMEQVEDLLIQLGELPPPGGSPQTVRVIDAAATPETLEYLRQIQQQWQGLSNVPLELPDADDFKEVESEVTQRRQLDRANEDEDDEDPSRDEATDFDPSDVTDLNSSSDPSTRLVGVPSDGIEETAEGEVSGDVGGKVSGSSMPSGRQIQSVEDFDRLYGSGNSTRKKSQTQQADSKAPIRIHVDADGNLVLQSDNTAALDRLEMLMVQVKPPSRPYRVFHVQHASATWMALNLEDYFEEEEEGDSNADRFFNWYWGDDDEEEKREPSGLGRAGQLRFISDIDTNTIVVTGASNSQLRTIAELIELWDQAEVDSSRTRYTRLVTIQYGQAETIAETVKEAYRDLLSSNDKTFQAGNVQNNQGQPVQKSREGSGSRFADSETGREGGGADFSFKGKLSLGVDSIGNTLLVSAEGESLLELVCEMIGRLDEAAQPKGNVRVMKMGGGVSGDSMKEAMKLFGTSKPSSDAPNPRPSIPPSPKQ